MEEKVAVIILNYKTWEDTLSEIASCVDVLDIDYKDIIVVDNASPNESAEKLQQESVIKGFSFLANSINRGYAFGNNVGMRYAYARNYKYALILNNDIIFSDNNLIDKELEIFRKDNKIAVVNTDILSPEGYLYNRDAKRPTFFDYTFGALFYRLNGRKIDDLGGYAYIYRPQGCCMMVDLEKMDKIRYMDEHTFLYCEEPILAERLIKENYKCALCTTEQIIHNHSTTVSAEFDRKKRAKIITESFKYYLREYRHFNKIKTSLCLLFNNIKMRIRY